MMFEKTPARIARPDVASPDSESRRGALLSRSRLIKGFGVLLILVVVLASVWRVWDREPLSPALPTSVPPEEGFVDLQERALDRISPGTIVEKSAPKGWSDLVYVAKLRIRGSDASKVFKTVFDYARLFTVNCLANVTAHDRGDTVRYRLDRVAIGIGTEINGQNTIITSETQRELGADLDLIARQLLSQTESDFENGFTQIARTRTMLVYESNAILLIEGEHREIITRNAILVSPQTGQLRALVWLFDQNYQLMDHPIQCLPPALQEDRVLSVNPDKFVLGLPREGAFAQVRMAQGKSIPWTESLRTVAGLRRFTKETALELEQHLTRVVNEAIGGESS